MTACPVADAESVIVEGRETIAKNKALVFRTTFGVYTAVRAIGTGRSGRVFEVRDSDGTPFAVKLLDPKNLTGDKYKRFENEIAFCQCRHQ